VAHAQVPRANMTFVVRARDDALPSPRCSGGRCSRRILAADAQPGGDDGPRRRPSRRKGSTPPFSSFRARAHPRRLRSLRSSLLLGREAHARDRSAHGARSQPSRGDARGALEGSLCSVWWARGSGFGALLTTKVVESVLFPDERDRRSDLRRSGAAPPGDGALACAVPALRASRVTRWWRSGRSSRQGCLAYSPS
jgi:hypothetical protein